MLKNLQLMQYKLLQASKRAIQKTAEATGDLMDNKIADKITSVSKRSSAELPSKHDDANSEIEVPKSDT